jgi:hypothetical protein
MGDNAIIAKSRIMATECMVQQVARFVIVEVVSIHTVPIHVRITIVFTQTETGIAHVKSTTKKVDEGATWIDSALKSNRGAIPLNLEQLKRDCPSQGKTCSRGLANPGDHYGKRLAASKARLNQAHNETISSRHAALSVSYRIDSGRFEQSFYFDPAPCDLEMKHRTRIRTNRCHGQT